MYQHYHTQAWHYKQRQSQAFRKGGWGATCLEGEQTGRITTPNIRGSAVIEFDIFEANVQLDH